MKQIYHEEHNPDQYEATVERLQKGYGIEHPQKISGFAGFLCSIPDVYAYGWAEKLAEENPRIAEEFVGFVKRFAREDYGFVSRDEYDFNGEQKWLGGGTCWTIARYAFRQLDLQIYGGMVLEFFDEYGLIYCVEEDMSEIHAKYYKDPENRHDLRYIGSRR